MKLTHIFDAHVQIHMPPTMLPGVGGQHVIFDVAQGQISQVDGSGFDGVVEPVGGDWAFQPTGDDYWRLDIRSIVRLESGPRIHMRARGLVEINAKVQQALATGGEIQFGDAYFSSAVHFDTDPGAPPGVALLRHRLGLTQGRFGAGFVEYRMYRIDDSVAPATRGSAPRKRAPRKQAPRKQAPRKKAPRKRPASKPTRMQRRR